MSKIVIMDFFAEWCMPCKMQDPIIEELKKRFGEIEFKKIDIDENYDFAVKYQIHAVPTLIIEKDGEIFKKYVGVTPLKTLEEDIKTAIKSPESEIKIK